MSKAKQKSKKSKEATAQREDETGFMEGSADTSLKTGHSRSPGATGGEGSIQTSEVSGPGEEDQVKKKPGTFKRLRKGFSKFSSHSSKSSLKHAVQSPTSPTSVDDDSLRQSEEMEEVSENEVLSKSINQTVLAVVQHYV